MSNKRGKGKQTEERGVLETQRTRMFPGALRHHDAAVVHGECSAM